MGEKTDQQSLHSTIPGSPARSIQSEELPRRQPHAQRQDTFPHADEDEEEAPPAYGDIFGHIEDEHDDIGTRAIVADDGRVNININQKSSRISNLFQPALRPPPHGQEQEPYIPPSLAQRVDQTKPPRLNVVIQVVGSRGDVQPFVALGKVLKERFQHRVRLATHPVFRDFVESNGLEFFTIGGDPSELMAFMVKNPGLMPGFDTLRSGDIGHRRTEIGRMVKGCWRSCIESGDGTGPVASDDTVDEWASNDGGTAVEAQARPFVADAIVANPPSFAHIHCAEKLGIPLHMMFTMPWSPTQSFPHPLANIQSSNADTSMTNFMSYALVDMMTWQGLGDVINRFRRKSLGLDPVSLTWAPGMLARLKVPWTYCWSPALIPKPRDWQQHISISGFYFLDLASNYQPEADLDAFLKAGPPPVYIGFGSIVLDDPDGMTKLIFEAVKQSGQRALVSKGWGGFGAEDIGIPQGVFMLGNVPHDWLFKHVSCVVHHGGAGTTAAGIAAGKPTVIVPFFGDQPFWGAMVNKAGAGPAPLPSKNLTADSLAAAINEALLPRCVEKAKEMRDRIGKEHGSEKGAETFHHELDPDSLRCQLSPRRAAVWRIRRTDFRISAFAATILAHEKLLDFQDLKLYRPREYDVDDGPWDPITGGASALIETMGGMAMGIADMPVATLKALKIHPSTDKRKSRNEDEPSNRSTTPSRSESGLRNGSISELQAARRESMQSIEPNRKRSESASSAGSSSIGKEAATAQSIGDAIMSGAQSNSPVDQSSPSSTDPKNPPKSLEKQKPFKFDQEDLETLRSTGKGAWRFTETGIKSPLDFTLALAKGFHNAPKLYGDDTVRKPEKITDFQSGLKAAGKGFGFGLLDGITGLVTQPIRGAKKEGAAGFVKGVGKGIGGIALKPGAGFWGIPGYAAQGMYRELRKRFGPSVEAYIIAARTAQGFEEMQGASSQEYSQLIQDWDDVKASIHKKKHIGEEKMEEIKARYRDHKTRSRSSSMTSSFLRHPHRRATGRDGAAEDDEGPSEQVGAIHDAIASRKAPAHEAMPEDDELEEAIRRSVAETSKGNPEEDEAIERAIRTSIAELTQARNSGADDAEIGRALQESIADARKGNVARGPSSASRDEKNISNPIAASEVGSAHGTDEVDLQRAIAESQSSTSQHDADLERAINASKESTAKPDEHELQRAMTQSLEAHGRDEEAKRKEKEEEEVVMRYVMRQSEHEENLRKGKAGDSSRPGGL